MKTILISLVIGVVLFIIYQGIGVYRVLSNSKYNFDALSNIADFVSSGKRKINIDIENPISKNLSIKDVVFEFYKGGKLMGGFLPVDLKLSKGENNVSLELLNSTKLGTMGIDYVTNKLSEYDIIIKGNWLGIVPFKISKKLSSLI
jgi:hypothetical protein